MDVSQHYRPFENRRKMMPYRKIQVSDFFPQYMPVKMFNIKRGLQNWAKIIVSSTSGLKSGIEGKIPQTMRLLFRSQHKIYPL